MTGLVQSAVVRTNNQPGSICKIAIDAIKFDSLWKHYPSEAPSQDRHAQDVLDKTTGKVIARKGALLYENQCAIKVSVAIHGAGVVMKSFNGKGVIRLDGKKTALRAEELAAWLKTMPFCGLPTKPEIVTGKDWQAKIQGRTGIAFFRDYWSRDGEVGPASGDHIDLWNGSRLTISGLRGALQSFARFTLGASQGSFLYSDLGEAKEILFWEVK